MSPSTDPSTSDPHPELPSRAVKWLQDASQLIDDGRLDAAEALLILASIDAGNHPLFCYLRGLVDLRRGRFDAAIATLESATRAVAPTSGVWIALAEARGRAGRNEEAATALERAQDVAQSSKEWLAAGVEADRQGRHEQAFTAAERSLEADASNFRARLLRGRSAQILGRIDEAASDFRAATLAKGTAAEAWFSLTDLKTIRLLPAEIQRLTKLAQQPGLTEYQKILTGFALGRGQEDAQRYRQAFSTYQRANERVRMHSSWSAAGFSRYIDSIADTFPSAEANSDPKGREVIFIVGLPRSGTTLIEQTLAAHQKVEGASELPYLNMVLEGESERRRIPFPSWVPSATAADWKRMGEEYLALSARWRTDRAISTDKLPENWPYVGAVLAMLPQARIIDCRRDPVETCWSCYKQLFAPGRVGFAYNFEDLASYSKDQARLGDLWANRFPDQVRVQQHEAFLADAEAETRGLLKFCGLEFDPACLRFNEARRSVRSASAAQVRLGLMKDTRRTAGYGPLLDPLRKLFG